MLDHILKPTNLKRVTFFVIGDILISILTIYLSFLLRFNFNIPLDFYPAIKKMILFLIPIKIFFLYYFHLYFIVWRFFGFIEYKRLIFAHIYSYLLFSIIFFIFSNYFMMFPRSVIGIDLFLSIVFIGFFRAFKRFLIERGGHHFPKAIIYGANEKSNTLIQSSINSQIPYKIEAIVDEKYAGNYFSNIPVYSFDRLKDIIIFHQIDTILIAKELSQKELDDLISQCSSLGVNKFKKTQILQDSKAPKLKNISVEDLLARHPKDLDKNAIANFIKDKVILITGAGGSIGSEIARQCAKYGAKKLLLLDHSEYNLYAIEEELSRYKPIPILKSIVDKELLEESFKKYKIDILIHAAAYKHVPLCEYNIAEAVKNNILGTKNVIDLSIKYQVKKFVLISTDKAVRPTNVMGATKRVCELYAQNVSSLNTEIVAVRFGNVLGSSGSVIPKFKKQIEQGGPITVTHPDITRYFMLIPEACQLVLQAATIGKGGEIFILDMGEPVKIVDLAKKMCELSGKKDIKIEFTGLRPGEKLYEELLIDEADAKTKYKSIMVAKPTKFDLKKLNDLIEKLLKSDNKVEILRQIVPEFKHKRL